MITVTSTHKYRMSFRSNPERERELRRLRELAILEAMERIRRYNQTQEILRQQSVNIEKARINMEQAKKENTEIQRKKNEVLNEVIKEIHFYPNPDNEMSTKMAGFLSQFTCAIQNNSKHDIREFFGDEKTAKELREKLSPSCQHDSEELRDELQKIDEINDPVMMLLAANKMKKFAPKQGILSKEQHEALVQGLKDTITMSIDKMDLSKFDEDDKFAIAEMVQMVKASDSVDFGISVKLKALVDKLNKKKLNIGFIPPVQVRELLVETQKMQG